MPYRRTLAHTEIIIMLENLFHPISTQRWERKDRFEEYYYKHRCTFDVTSDIDATPLTEYCERENKDFYTVLLYFVSKVVNSDRTYRYAVSPYMGLGYWDVIHPEYTVYCDKLDMFMHACTKFDDDFNAFYDTALSDMTKLKQGERVDKSSMPANRFFISYLPWRHFTGLSMNTEDDFKCLLPTLIIGKCKKENGKDLLPVSAKLHRASCDGKDAAELFNRLEEEIAGLDS